MIDINSYIVKYKFLDHSTCNQIMSKYKKNNFEKHHWSDGKNIEYENEKELEVTYLNNEDASFIFKDLEKFLCNYQDRFKKNERTKTLINHVSSFRINRYPKNTYMREHFDHIYSIFDGNQKGIPILSILILLNDDFQGGDFKINGQSQNMSKGDLIIFPSCFMFPHGVELVTEGTRYSLIAWGY